MLGVNNEKQKSRSDMGTVKYVEEWNRLLCKDLRKIPVSLVLAFPVKSCRKSWYSLVSDICILWDE